MIKLKKVGVFMEKDKYILVQSIKIKPKDEKFMVEYFYKLGLTIQIKDQYIYCPKHYVELVREVVDAYEENRLDLSIMKKPFDLSVSSERKTVVGNNKKIKFNFFKIIIPIVLAAILLVLIRFLYEAGFLNF